jgi:isopentenyldiphosphate isomerase
MLPLMVLNHRHFGTGASMSIQEHVILVNDQGMVIGTQEKYAAHTLHTPLHLAFSSWLFNAKANV